MTSNPPPSLRSSTVRSPWRLMVAVLGSLLIAVSLSGQAMAETQEDNGGLADVPVITGVDARTNNVELSVLSTDYGVATSDVSVVEDGQEVESVTVNTARGVSRPTELVFVVDIDNRNSAESTLGRLNQAISAAVADLPSEFRVAVVSAGSQARIESRLTDDPDRIISDLQAINADQGAAIFDAVHLAGRAFSDDPNAVRSVIVFSGGLDTASQLTPTDAGSELVRSGAQLISIRYRGGESQLSEVTGRAGGTSINMAESAAAAEAVNTAVAIASDRLLVSYPGIVESGSRGNVTLTVANAELRASYPAGLITQGSLQLAPTGETERSNLSFFGNSIVLYFSILLAFVGITLAVWSLGSMYAGGQSTLDSMLARYSDRDESLQDDEIQEMLIQSSLIRRAVDMTEDFAERRGLLARAEDLLERAHLPIRAGEALFLLLAAVTLSFGVIFIVANSLFLALIVSLIVAAGGYFLVQFMARRRLSRFEAQLPDTLQLLAGTLRAGYSLPQGLDAVSDEIADPMGYELRRAITEAQLGRELEDALNGIAERLDSPDFAWAVMAIGIQREVGGNLNELLMTVSETMIQRERLRRDVNALTAEGRVSAAILSFMPPGLGLVLWVMNPDYVEILFSRTLGLVLLGVAAVSALIGLVWMKKVITIDA